MPEKIFQGTLSLGVGSSFAELSEKEKVKTYYKAGAEYAKSLDYIPAIGEFEKVLILEPEHEKTLLWLGWLHRRLAREQRDKRDIYLQKSIDYYKRAIKAGKRASSYNELSSLYLELNMYQEAFEAADKAIEVDPESARSWHYRGVANRFLGNFPGAKEDFEKSLELDPDNYIVEKYLSDVSGILE